MSRHNQLVWDEFLLCIGMELAFTKRGENPIDEQKIAEKMMELGAWQKGVYKGAIRPAIVGRAVC